MKGKGKWRRVGVEQQNYMHKISYSIITYTGANVMKLLNSPSDLPRLLCPTFSTCRNTRSAATSPGM